MTLTAPSPARALRPTRIAVRSLFFAFGTVTGAWGAHVPSAKARYGLDEAQLSLALLAAAVGAVGALLVAGRIIGRHGPRQVVPVAAVVIAAALGTLLLHGGFAALVATMVVFGAAGAFYDVSINAEGTLLEERSGFKVVSGFHGMWSLGAMTGAGGCSALLAAGVPAAWQLGALAIVVLALSLVAARSLLPDHPPVPEGPRGWRLPPPRLLLLGGLAALGLLAEGVIYDWSVLWFTDSLGQTQAVGGLGYAAFAAAMAASRFGGDALRSRFHAATLLAASAGLAALAMSAALLLHHPVVGVVAMALVGAGLANVVPILFVAGGRQPGVTPADGIAAVSSLGYFGLLAGPPLVGAIAHASSLNLAMATLVAAALALAAGARLLR
ncbi:fucose permease [Rubrivivax gelatinosus]|uniref:MFS transporter n=1 Tax=Rubrivivax gelatinosus TaxID=28068 RepID=UPI0018C93EBD|nr:MFS transporter [Rubrivivax gelatinosus]MBG6079061.1 fucose permease [Rubrivivax gelatinosus]